MTFMISVIISSEKAPIFLDFDMSPHLLIWFLLGRESHTPEILRTGSCRHSLLGMALVLLPSCLWVLLTSPARPQASVMIPTH